MSFPFRGHAQGQFQSDLLDLCAERQVMKNYDAFPDFLVIIDDGKWLDMDRFVSHLSREYSPKVPYMLYMLAGLIFLVKNDIGSLPFGGDGMIYTKAAFLELWTKPLIGCNAFS